MGMCSVPCGLCKLHLQAPSQAVWDQTPADRAGAGGLGWQAGHSGESHFVLVRVQDEPSAGPENLSKFKILMESTLSLSLKISLRLDIREIYLRPTKEQSIPQALARALLAPARAVLQNWAHSEGR